MQDRTRGQELANVSLPGFTPVLLWTAHTFSISLLQCFRCATCASGIDRIVDRAVVSCNDIISDQPL